MNEKQEICSSETSESEMQEGQNPDLDGKLLEFAVFCIENLAEDLRQDTVKVFDMLTKESDLLHSYIIPCYESLHTQDRDYIIGDIKEIMMERGMLP